MATDTRMTYVCAGQMAVAFAAGDPAKGNVLLELVASRQDRTTTEDKLRGNFLKFAGDPFPIDGNVIAWVTPCLAYVGLAHRAHLTEANRRLLFETVLPECLEALDGHHRVTSGGQPGDPPGDPRPRWWQCNVWFNLIAARLMAGLALEREEQVATARQRMADSVHYINTCGIAEYGSSYTGVSMRGLHWCFHYAPDPIMREHTRQVLDRFYIETAEQYHAAAGVMAGTWSRHYPKNLRADSPDCARWAKAVFGERPPDAPPASGVSVFEVPHLLAALGLTDAYVPPESARRAALTREPYTVWRRSMPNHVERMLYQNTEFSLATQSGAFIWMQQDTPLVITHAAPDSLRRVALINTPYWGLDPRAATDYARPFTRWAHQHENRAILSFGHAEGGNELLLSLGSPAEVGLGLHDAAGMPLQAPHCPFLPAPPDVHPGGPKSPLHMHDRTPDYLTYGDPAGREPPGLAVEGAVLVEFPSCYLAVLPAPGLTLRVAIMEQDAKVVIPVRPTALVGVVLVGRRECATAAEFAEYLRDISLDEVALSSTGRAACLRGGGPTLTAARDADGRLTDRRIDDVRPDCREYMCHSPFFKQRCGEPCGQTREQ